jgi:Fe-S cluster biogenesis protein NfuA
MFRVINIEETPNPDALKFILDQTLLVSGVRQFDNAQAGSKDPLARPLFALGGIESVFYMGGFVTVAKFPNRGWDDLKPQVVKAVEENAEAAKTSAARGTGAGLPSPDSVESGDLLKKINQVLEETVIPALAADGGGIEVLGLDDHVLTIHYQGACGSCPSSTAGTMTAVQSLLQRMIDPRIQVIPG